MDSTPINKLMVPEEGTISPTRIFLNFVLVYVTRYWAILVPVFLFTRMLYRRYASPLRSIPGPFLASCTRLWKLRSTVFF